MATHSPAVGDNSNLLLNLTSHSLSVNKLGTYKNSVQNKLKKEKSSLQPKNKGINELATKVRKTKQKNVQFKKRQENIEKKETLLSPHISKPFISSLFTYDTSIPEVKLIDVKHTVKPLFSQKKFEELHLHPFLTACLRDRFEVTTMTEVQERAIPTLLNGKDALVKSLTGSGKTLSYAVPIIQQLQEIRPKIQRSDGIYALVIVPTRELAVQSYECFQKLTQAFTWIVAGCLMGEEKRKSEKSRIRKGLNILVSTPGRLLDHIQHTAKLNLRKVNWVVIDEADRLTDLGFEQTVSEIIKILNTQCESSRQTVLLSATLSKGVERLAGMSLTDPSIIDVIADSHASTMTSDFIVPDKLRQHFILTPVKMRLVVLSAFIIEKCALGRLKALIFMAAQDIVDFHHALFQSVLQDLLTSSGCLIKFSKLHGNMKQQDRIQVFQEFKEASAGILLCTDVAARGLDLFNVDWIVQYSAPIQPEDYVHRVGRTARIGKQGQALLFLMPTEVEFIEFLQQHKISLEEMDLKNVLKSVLFLTNMSEKKKHIHHLGTVEEHASSLQMKYENAVYDDKHLLDISKKAYTSYLRSYSSYPKTIQNIFHFKRLHLGHVAKSFCLREAPSALGSSVAAMVKRQRNKKFARPNVFKKKPSEFDSGLDSFDRKNNFSNFHKQKTFPEISEYDSGLDSPSQRLSFKKVNLKRKPEISEYDSGLDLFKKRRKTTLNFRKKKSEK